MGGGRSSSEATFKCAFPITDPTALMALHWTTKPSSVLSADGIVNIVRLSSVSLVSNREKFVFGKTNERSPLIDQNIVGCGFPELLHSNETGDIDSTNCELGFTINFGNAIKIENHFMLNWYNNFFCVVLGEVFICACFCGVIYLWNYRFCHNCS